jgi:CheY-like chemotaxis protein
MAYASRLMTTGRRLLFADDDPGVQRAVKRLAEKNGFELVQVLAGSDVYEAAVAQAPDLIVLDIHFPDADGRDVLSRLKADPRTRAIPVVVWSGRDPNSDRRIALDLGAEDYVEKRDPSTLLPKIERVLLRLRDAG